MPCAHGAKPGGPSGPDRRAFLRSSALAAIASAAFGTGLVGRPLVGWAAAELHGLSVFGQLKYPPGFAHFDYIKADAPKGGRLVQSAHDWRYNQNPQTFNTLNGFVLKGDAPPRTELLFDTLTVRAFDEPDAVYCHLASSVSLSPDGNRYSFALRPEARFHDGSPVTAEDVVFSFNLLKEKGHPNLRVALAELEKAEVDGDRAVLVFSGSQQKQAAIDISYMVPIFSKAYYETMDFDRSTLEPPLGSGSLSGRCDQCRQFHRLRARSGLLGQGSSHFHRARQFRCRADVLWPRACGPVRGLQEG